MNTETWALLSNLFFSNKVLQQVLPYPTLYTVHYDEIIYMNFTATNIDFVQGSVMVQTNSLVKKGGASPGV